MSVMLDGPDAKALSHFYAELLGKAVTYEADGVAMIGEDGAQPVMFQQVEHYTPPRWPDPAYPQQIHLDVTVQDVDAAERAVLDIGATRLDGAGPNWRVYADPAGKPFCWYGRSSRTVLGASGRPADHGESTSRAESGSAIQCPGRGNRNRPSPATLGVVRVDADFEEEYPGGDATCTEAYASLCRTGEALLAELDRRIRLTFDIPQAAATALAGIDGARAPLTPPQGRG